MKETTRLKMSEQTALTCHKCGNVFQTPILATVTVANQVHTYEACPRCMSKAQAMKMMRSEDKGDSSTLKRETVKPAQDSRDNETCPHSFGYLSTRPKGAAVPEHCLTCDRMIDCVTHY